MKNTGLFHTTSWETTGLLLVNPIQIIFLHNQEEPLFAALNPDHPIVRYLEPRKHFFIPIGIL
jgi:hypothetical protein